MLTLWVGESHIVCAELPAIDYPSDETRAAEQPNPVRSVAWWPNFTRKSEATPEFRPIVDPWRGGYIPNSTNDPWGGRPQPPVATDPAARAGPSRGVTPPIRPPVRGPTETPVRPRPNSTPVHPPAAPPVTPCTPDPPPGPPAPRTATNMPVRTNPLTHPQPGRAAEFESARIIAIVGDQYILAGDLLWQINSALKQYKGKVPEEQLERQRELMLKQFLPRAIENKLAYVDFLREVPADKVAEITNRVTEQFDKTQLEKLMKEAEVNSPAELDAQLREIGSSLKMRRRFFAEQILSREAVRKNVKIDENVAHEELLAYYREHIGEFQFPARCRWEQLSVRFSNHSTKGAAYRALAEMGNEVIGGAPLEAVARRRSEGANAQQGGLYDWTTKGALVSKPLDTAIFTLPPNSLSQITEDDRGFHIVRVIEREDAGCVPFVEAQVEIKEKVRSGRREQLIREYLDRLREETRIWTVFDAGESSAVSAAAPARSQGAGPLGY